MQASVSPGHSAQAWAAEPLSLLAKSSGPDEQEADCDPEPPVGIRSHSAFSRGREQGREMERLDPALSKAPGCTRKAVQDLKHVLEC